MSARIWLRIGKICVRTASDQRHRDRYLDWFLLMTIAVRY